MIARPLSPARTIIRALLLPLLGIALSWFPASAATDLTYVFHPPTIPSAHPPLIFLMHGSGADERDMISMWPQLPGQFLVVAARGPFADANGGYRWYRGNAANAAADIALARKIVDAMLDNAIQRFDADPHRIFIGGFSQGGVMTYEVDLDEPGRFRGAVVLSGLLRSAAFPKADHAHDAFFIGHGTADQRIPFAAATKARAALETLGVPVTFHAYAGMKHGTSEAEMKDLGAWLAGRL